MKIKLFAHLIDQQSKVKIVDIFIICSILLLLKRQREKEK